MFTVTIVPLSAPDSMTLAANAALLSAEKLFLQTAQHPLIKVINDLDVPYTAMDDLYAAAEDFDALNAAIAERLADAGTCVYAVTGNVDRSQLPAISALVKARGGNVRMLPAVSLGRAAFPELPAARTVAAEDLPKRISVSEPIIVEEIDDAIRAGNVKLLLSEYFPDDWPVLLSSMDEDCAFHRSEIPLYALDRQKAYGPATALYVPAAPFDRLDRFGYAEMTDVIRRLRAPDGCPWDREQTHASLKQSLLEECYELLDAIDGGDDTHICEELGDVLMQVAMHAEIAAEQGRFTERDVNTELVKKLVYRHPHVFGTVKADTSEEVLANWDKLKMVEKAQDTQTAVLESVPRNLPSLTRAYKVQKKAAKVGFDWPDALEALPKVLEEADEVRRACLGDGDPEEEMGDLLFAAVNVSRLLHFDPELTLRAATDKFVRRFAAMESLATDSGRKLCEMTLSEMDVLWNTAKLPKESDKS